MLRGGMADAGRCSGYQNSFGGHDDNRCRMNRSFGVGTCLCGDSERCAR